MNLLFHRCPVKLTKMSGELLHKSGNNDRKRSFSRVCKIIRIPSLMKCGFLPIDPFVGIPVFSSQSFPSDNTGWACFSRDFHCQKIFSTDWHKQLPLLALALLHWRLWTIVGTARFLQGTHFSVHSSPFLLIMWH